MPRPTSIPEKLSDIALLNYYHRHKRFNEISDGHNAELARRFANYDPSTRTFWGHPMKRVAGAHRAPKKIDWRAKSDASLKQFFYTQRRTGKIDPELNAEMGRRFPHYDMESHKLRRLGRRTVKSLIMANDLWGQPDDVPVTDINACIRTIRKMSKNPITNDDYDPDTEPDVANRTIIRPPHGIKLPNVKPGTTYIVTKSEIQHSDNVVYNQISINGTPIIDQHINTKLQTFLGGRILGIYGINPNETAYPRRALWQMIPMIPGFTSFTKLGIYHDHYVYIKQVFETPDGEIRLLLSNNSHILFSAKQFDRLTNAHIFKIANEHIR